MMAMSHRTAYCTIASSILLLAGAIFAARMSWNIAVPPARSAHAIVRFHLHHRVSAAMLGNGQVLMKIRGNRNGWLFKASGGEVGLDNSVYFDAGIRHSCQQIIVRSPLSEIRTLGRQEIKWAFRRSET